MCESYSCKQSTFIALLKFIEKKIKGESIWFKKEIWESCVFGRFAADNILSYSILYVGKTGFFSNYRFLDDEVIQYMLSGKYFFTGFNTKVAEWFNGADKFAIQPPCFLLIWPFYFCHFIKLSWFR